MDNIEAYNNSLFLFDYKFPKKVISWVTILFLVSIAFLIFINIPYCKYKNYIGYIEFVNDDYYIKIKLEESDFPIRINNFLYIKGKKYKFNVIDIRDDEVTLKIKLDNNYLVNNNKLLLNILSEKTSLFRLLKEKIKKGLDL